MDADFSGYATKAGLKCSDGRTITPEAFKHMDQVQVPLVWQHGHSSPENVLGHAILEHREDGVYAYGFFNDTVAGKNAKVLVQHKDITSLSIYANSLVERAKQVLHGVIREVSLVLSGANPGALIDYVAVQHSDGSTDILEDEAIVYTGLPIEHAHQSTPATSNAQTTDSGPTVQEVYDSLNEAQKNVVHYMIGAALEEATATHSDGTPDTTPPASTTAPAATPETAPEGNLVHQEGTNVTRNVFENGTKPAGEQHVLTHDAIRGIVSSAQKGGSLKQAVEDYALQHGIEDIDVLFPDAKAVMDRPEFDKRRTEWVAGVLNGTRKTPFSRIKSLSADLTLEDARAKGYVKGTLKKEEFFRVSKRVTTPQTVYKKQKLDRDDILDITDFDVVAWLKAEMRLMLEEELATAVLIGDGRDVEDEDKIQEDRIRPIASDDDLYAATININLDDASSSYLEFVDAVISNRQFYKGSGTPTMYTTELVVSKMLTLRDAQGRRLYRTMDELATELRVAAIVPVETMERVPDVVAIIVNLNDYTIGADKGGEVSMFDDFDIDYNQHKYLIETRVSGALTKIRSALVFRKVAGAAALVTPAAPVQEDDEVTVTNTTGATYKIGSFEGAVTYNGDPVEVDDVVTASFPIILPDGGQVVVYAVPASGSYFFANNVEDEWTFDYDA
jgi:hypothetical protein